MFYNQQIDFIGLLISIFALLTAIPIHEYAHARMAVRLGDRTPYNMGRLTLNPAAHLDIIGSIALVAFGFGWGKPVPINDRNFKHWKRDVALVSLAGPAANLLVALLFVILSKPVLAYMPAYRYSATPGMVEYLFNVVIAINVYIALFNLLPFAPLDGANILGFFLPARVRMFFDRHYYHISLIMVFLLLLGVLQIPFSFASNYVIRFFYWVTSPLNALFR